MTNYLKLLVENAPGMGIIIAESILLTLPLKLSVFYSKQLVFL